MVRIVKTPNRDFYLQKSHKATNAFVFPVRKRATGNKKGFIYKVMDTLNIYAPKELEGKKIMFKVEIVK